MGGIAARVTGVAGTAARLIGPGHARLVPARLVEVSKAELETARQRAELRQVEGRGVVTHLADHPLVLHQGLVGQAGSRAVDPARAERLSWVGGVGHGDRVALVAGATDGQPPAIPNRRVEGQRCLSRANINRKNQDTPNEAPPPSRERTASPLAAIGQKFLSSSTVCSSFFTKREKTWGATSE